MERYEKYKDSGVAWIGEIPEHWDIVRLKYRTINMDSKRVPLRADDRGNKGPYPYYGATGIIDYVDEYIFEGTNVLVGEDGAPFFIPNRDVAFIAEGKYWVNNHAHILGCSSSIIPEVLKHMLNIVDYSAHISGSTRDKLTQTEMNDINLIEIPISEQTAIAAYLDTKTTQIDQLIANKQRLIELLKEERTAIINQAVTKGLDPTVPMKTSGIEWLGDIPAHWEIKKLKYVATKIGDGLHGTPIYNSNGQYYFINGNNLGAQSIEVNWNTNTVSREEYEKYKLSLNENTVLVSLNGTIGNLSFYNGEPIVLSKSVGYLCLASNVCERQYIYHALQSKYVRTYFDLSLAGSTISNLSLNTMRNLKIAYPPNLGEQCEIAKFITDKHLSITSTINRINHEIQLLQEYRTTLISEVVTGKVKVV